MTCPIPLGKWPPQALYLTQDITGCMAHEQEPVLDSTTNTWGWWSTSSKPIPPGADTPRMWVRQGLNAIERSVV